VLSKAARITRKSLIDGRRGHESRILQDLERVLQFVGDDRR
jgi:hypothetical protein